MEKQKIHKVKSEGIMSIGTTEKYICTDCGGDAMIAYTASKKTDWNGLIKIGERVCLLCARKRNIKFF